MRCIALIIAVFSFAIASGGCAHHKSNSVTLTADGKRDTRRRSDARKQRPGSPNPEPGRGEAKPE